MGSIACFSEMLPFNNSYVVKEVLQMILKSNGSSLEHDKPQIVGCYQLPIRKKVTVIQTEQMFFNRNKIFLKNLYSKLL